jgi:hypothetical protein
MGKTSIPIKPDYKCIEQLMRIHKEWSKVKAITLPKRNNPNSLKKKSEFVRDSTVGASWFLRKINKYKRAWSRRFY